MTVRKKCILGAILAWIPCVALGALGYLFVLGPQIQRVEALEAELMSARDLYSQAMQASKKENQAKLAREVGLVDSRVCDFVLRPQTAPDLAFEIAELASTTEVQAFTLKPQGKEGITSIPNCHLIGEREINVSFTSPFHQFAALLNALERHRPVLFVETFSISRPERQTESPRVDMELSVLVENPKRS
jgi:hypothetical protein